MTELNYANVWSQVLRRKNESICMWHKSHVRSRQLLDDSSVQHYQFIGRTFAWDAEFEQKVQALSGEQIRAALAKYIDPAKFVVMKAGDFTAAAKAAPAAPAAKP